VREACELSVYIADNSIDKEQFDYTSDNIPDVSLIRLDNLGYLGGALRILNDVENVGEYDYIIVSNVDIELDRDFFNNLLAASYAPEIGWVAPQIFTEQEQRDKNPKILSRPSLKKMKLLRLMYRHPILHRLYENTLYKRKKLRPVYPAQRIYAGHGSMMIFTGKAMADLLPMHYPVFLFGEECFLAERLNEKGYDVFYDPAVKIIDREHVSTGEMKSKFYYDCNREAIEYIISEFYE